MYPKLIKSKIKLTIGMLVSNHINTIRNCMESIKPLLDAVPSELVVLDTKGEETDGSIDVVREYTDKIYHFEWCNDFSAARNDLLDHAQGEWFLYLDDDEWFDDVQEFIDFFKNGDCEKYYTGFYYTRDYSADGDYSMGIAGRMIRRTEKTRFVGKVHETFNEVYAPNKQFSCFTHHYGYVFSDAASRLKHQERNLSILKGMLQTDGYTPKICAQIAQEYLSVEETGKKGYDFCMEALPKLQEAGKMADSYSQWLLVASVRHFSRTGESEKLMEQARYIEQTFSLSEMAKIALAAVVVLSAAEHEDAEHVLKYATIYLENVDWSKANPEEALLQNQLDFPKYLAENYYLEMIRLGALAANYLQEYKKANQFWKRIPWDQKGLDKAKYAADLQVTINGLKQLQQQEEEAELQAVKEPQTEGKKTELKLMLESLLEAGAYTKTSVLEGRYEELNELLTGMQEMAITIGQGIDEHIGEGTQAVAMLEEFCECVWQCSQAEEVEPLLAYLDRGNHLVREILETGF